MNNGLRTLLILVVIVVAIWFSVSFMPSQGFGVAFPVVQLAPEHIWLEPWGRFLGQDMYVNNTLPSFVIASITVLVMGLTAGAAARKKLNQYRANPKAVDEEGDDLMVPKGWHNTFETIIETIYNLNEQIVGSKWARASFPLVMTLFILILTANWLHFLPITDAVGLVHCADPAKGKSGFPLREFGDSNVYYLEVNQWLEPAETGAECPKHGEEGGEEEALTTGEQASVIEAEDEGVLYVITPFVRTATTDLSFTLALSIVAMVMVQYYGIKELGFGGYFSKFLNIPALTKGGLGIIEFVVGILEAISEVLKVVSFSLRLLGNLFAGTILLFVMVFLVPLVVPVPFFLLEVLIGLLQAFVFAMLTMVFISVAQAGHGDHDEHGEAHH